MDNNNLAEKIKTLRKEKQMTLEDVASIVGVGKSTVRKWENGIIANMRRDKISSLAKALDTTPEYLMGWQKENNKIQLSDDEMNMIFTYRNLSNDKKMLAIQMLQAMK